MNPYVNKLYWLIQRNSTSPYEEWVNSDHPSDVCETLEWVDPDGYPYGILIDFYRSHIDIYVDENKKYTHTIYNDQDVEDVLDHLTEVMEED